MVVVRDSLSILRNNPSPLHSAQLIVILTSEVGKWLIRGWNNWHYGQIIFVYELFLLTHIFKDSKVLDSFEKATKFYEAWSFLKNLNDFLI